MATLKYSPTGGILSLESSPKEDVIYGKSIISRKRCCLFHDHTNDKSDTKKVLEMFDAHVTDKGWEAQTVVENINPYICYLNHNLVVYFGEDKPVLKSKSVKSCTPGYKKWTGWNWKNPKEKETYYYVEVNEPEKLFIFGNTYHFDSMTEENKHETLEVVNEQYVCRYDMTQEEWEKHMQVKIQKDKEEKKRREEWAAELERRKQTPGYCSCCGAENAHLTVDPYYAEMEGDYTPVWLCHWCYESHLGDI